MLRITIDSTAARALLQRAEESCKGDALRKSLGRGLAEQLRKHFAQRHQDNPNKMGATRSNFWLQMRESVQTPEVTDDSVSVTVGDDRINQKVYGGTLTPKRRKWLTIPVTKESYNRRAPDFPRPLRFVPGRGGDTAYLFEAGDLRVNGRKQGALQYVLKRSITQTKDAEALPTSEAIESEALARMEKFVKRLA